MKKSPLPRTGCARDCGQLEGNVARTALLRTSGVRNKMETLQMFYMTGLLGEDPKMAHSGISAGAKGRLVAVIGDEVRS